MESVWNSFPETTGGNIGRAQITQKIAPMREGSGWNIIVFLNWLLIFAMKLRYEYLLSISILRLVSDAGYEHA